MRVVRALVCALALALETAAAQVPAAQIDAVFSPVATGATPGLAVGIIRDGKLIFARGYGLANLETGVPIRPGTDFRLASLTKQFTATAVMLLAHDGKLRYDGPLTKLLPEFPAYGKNITVRHLLNHTSGLKDYEDIYDAQMANTPRDKIPQLKDADVLRLMEQQTSTIFAPGTRWQYSNSGYAVLAMIVERVSGKPFGDFLRDRIFRPLHMNDTLAFEKGRNRVPRRAYGYRKHKDTGQWEFADQSPTSAVLGDGGVYTSIEDMARWDASLARHTLLTEAEMKPAYEPVSVEGGVQAPDGSASAYGFGWFLDPYKGHRRMWHYGETSGFHTSIQRLPEERLTVVVLANRIDIDPGALALKVVDLFVSAK